MTIKGKCHCGAVHYEFRDTPEWATRCNCSICRRLGTLWIYTDAANITINADDTNTLSYSHGDKDLDFRTCKTCGTTILWQSAKNPGKGRTAVNLNMAELDVITKIPVRHFDGADSWKFLDDQPGW